MRSLSLANCVYFMISAFQGKPTPCCCVRENTKIKIHCHASFLFSIYSTKKGNYEIIAIHSAVIVSDVLFDFALDEVPSLFVFYFSK